MHYAQQYIDWATPSPPCSPTTSLPLPLGQVRLLFPGQPHAFFFETLEENRYYTISLDGVDNADARTGAFTTLKVLKNAALKMPPLHYSWWFSIAVDRVDNANVRKELVPVSRSRY